MFLGGVFSQATFRNGMADFLKRSSALFSDKREKRNFLINNVHQVSRATMRPPPLLPLLLLLLLLLLLPRGAEASECACAFCSFCFARQIISGYAEGGLTEGDDYNFWAAWRDNQVSSCFPNSLFLFDRKGADVTMTGSGQPS
eukprot:COSAG06_NODE_12395_length_1387_cov_1.591615_1_plen_142_part_10